MQSHGGLELVAELSQSLKNQQRTAREPSTLLKRTIDSDWMVESNVSFGSLADILTSPHHVRFTPNNGRWAAHPSQHLAVGL
jgi:hypothetical protein